MLLVNSPPPHRMTATPTRLTRGMVSVLAIICTGHTLIDAASITTLLRGAKVGDAPTLFLLYLVLAFGLQGPIGYLLDRTPYARSAAWVGAVVTAAGALLLPVNPILAVLVVGVGNSLYHLGAGTVALQMDPGRARSIGIFVSTGAIGVTIGVLMAATPTAPVWPLSALLVVLCAGLWPLQRAPHPAVEMPSPPRVVRPLLVLASLLLMYAILIRSLVQLSVGFPWRVGLSSGWALAATWGLTAVVVLGKALGGVIADRFGWAQVSAVALVASVPLMLLGRGDPTLSLAGVLLFNVPMAVTLVAIARALPRHPATAFGLTPTALFFGAIPAFSLLRGVFAFNLPGALAVASAIVAIIAGVSVMLHAPQRHSPA